MPEPPAHRLTDRGSAVVGPIVGGLFYGMWSGSFWGGAAVAIAILGGFVVGPLVAQGHRVAGYLLALLFAAVGIGLLQLVGG